VGVSLPTRVRPEAIHRARQLRRTMTDGERKLWSELREFRRWYGVHVRKQAPVGPYFPDFVVHEHRLVIEVDGEHHFTSEGLVRDVKRDAWLESIGYRVLRFNTGELSESFDGCVTEILDALGLMKPETTMSNAPPPLTPPLKGEGDVNASARRSNDTALAESPSPLRGGVRGGGKVSRLVRSDA